MAEPAKPVPAVATTYIAPGTELTGTLKTDSNVEICGKFEGDIISTGTVLLRADHHGNVTAKQLELNGKSMQGDAAVSETMTIGAGSVITGNLVVGTLVCHGVINGDVQCSGAGQDRPHHRQHPGRHHHHGEGLLCQGQHHRQLKMNIHQEGDGEAVSLLSLSHSGHSSPSATR